jgi:hypothetical protein
MLLLVSLFIIVWCFFGAPDVEESDQYINSKRLWLFDAALFALLRAAFAAAVAACFLCN